MRPPLEVADIFRRHGAAWRAAQAGHVSLAQLKVMSAIETCRTAVLGGHIEACEDCDHTRIAYNSCRNRHCPKCQGAAAREWLAAREADLLPVGYFHVVFTLPAEVADIAFHNKAVVYDLLFRAASETMLTIAADPRRLGARIGITAVLHTWGSSMTHHPHIHMIVPGGGFSLDGERWVTSRPAFLLPVRVLAKLFRRLFLTRLLELHANGRLRFFGDHVGLSDRRAFLRHLAPLRKKKWVVYAKPPFAGPEAVLAYLSRYTHRVAISNRRLISLDDTGVTFRYKDYRRDGDERYRTMTLQVDEFIRRFLLHVLPKGFHRIRHYGLLASARPQGQCRPRQGAARRPYAARDGGARTAAQSTSTVSVLRRSHGRHRDHPGRCPAARPTSLTRVHRDDGLVTRRGDPQSLVEAAPLRLSGDCMSRPTAYSAAMLATTKSACLTPEQSSTGALAARPRRSASNASGTGRPSSGCLRHRPVHKSP